MASLSYVFLFYFKGLNQNVSLKKSEEFLYICFTFYVMFLPLSWYIFSMLYSFLYNSFDYKSHLPINGAKRHELPIIGSSCGPGIELYGLIEESSWTVASSIRCCCCPFASDRILMADENVVRLASVALTRLVAISCLPFAPTDARLLKHNPRLSYDGFGWKYILVRQNYEIVPTLTIYINMCEISQLPSLILYIYVFTCPIRCVC